MTADPPRVVISVPTGARPDGLERLLDAVAAQAAAAEHAEIVVVDNGDAKDETRRGVEKATAQTGVRATYLVEPERGIPFARNACVRAALDQGADALVFIDDDEWPAPNWLEALLATWQRTGADIVLGPAHGVLPAGAPRWARYSGVFDKDRRLPDGAPIRTAYSYNTLVSRRALETLGPAFDAAFRYTGSSDHHFFKQAAAAGLVSVWSSAALVYEEIDARRVCLSWVLKRGYRIGAGATRSTRLRLGGGRGVLRIALLTAGNLGFAAWHALRVVRHRWCWVEALRRLAIAVGLLGGTLHAHKEYAADGRLDPPAS